MIVQYNPCELLLVHKISSVYGKRHDVKVSLTLFVAKISFIPFLKNSLNYFSKDVYLKFCFERKRKERRAYGTGRRAHCIGHAEHYISCPLQGGSFILKKNPLKYLMQIGLFKKALAILFHFVYFSLGFTD